MKNIEITTVMPCLNEEKSVGKCVKEAQKTLLRFGYSFEIIVVDNGSSDKSAEAAKRAGAKIIKEKVKGYGSALKCGISRAKGKYIVICDCDGTYDFAVIPEMTVELKRGAGLVLASRFKGKIHPGAMPYVRRYLGNPLLTFMLNLFYGTRIRDAQTGMRAFTKESYAKLNMKSNGMEFASEMIIKAIYHKLKITEIAVNYYKRMGVSKLSPVSDAWRHIKYMLLYSPTYTFIFPGLIFFVSGIVFSIVLLSGGRRIFGWFFDIHTMTVAILSGNLGLQLILFGIFARSYTSDILGLPPGPLAEIFLKLFTPSRMLLTGMAFFISGLSVILPVSYFWIISDFGNLFKIREFIFAVGVGTIGTQLIYSSFLLSLFQGER